MEGEVSSGKVMLAPAVLECWAALLGTLAFQLAEQGPKGKALAWSSSGQFPDPECKGQGHKKHEKTTVGEKVQVCSSVVYTLSQQGK